MSKSDRPLAIIPAYNEADAIGATLSELRTVLPDVDVLVVDDGSTDGTAEIVRSCGVAVISLPFNLGIGGALRAGFKWAVRQGYETAFQFDADGQHNPGEVPALLAPLGHGADMVVGSRFHEGEPGYTVGRLRQRAMGSLRVTLRLLVRQSFTDTSSGFRAFNRPILEFFATNYPAEYMESVEALFIACTEGFTVAEVPSQMRMRSAGVPSSRRFRLVYHFLRLYVVLLASVGRRSTVVVGSARGAV
ncbi:MAG TPA: glycosyltransferase family 2 protein [Ilumatobacteraceae bacterium]|nr:glycosyltransferase family 2 protein [Ilumatobacteraceae bacterium]